MDAETDKIIRKSVGVAKEERPLVKLDRLNRFIKKTNPAHPYEPGIHPVRKIVGSSRPR